MKCGVERDYGNLERGIWNKGWMDGCGCKLETWDVEVKWKCGWDEPGAFKWDGNPECAGLLEHARGLCSIHMGPGICTVVLEYVQGLWNIHRGSGTCQQGLNFAQDELSSGFLGLPLRINFPPHEGSSAVMSQHHDRDLNWKILITVCSFRK